MMKVMCEVERGTSVRLRGGPFLLWFSPPPVEWVLQLWLFINGLLLPFIKRGVIFTAMYCIGLDVVFVFPCSVLLSCVCGD